MWKLLRNLVIVAVLCIAVLKLVLWYETQQGAARLVERLAPVAQLRFGSVGSSLDGEVAFHAVTLTTGKGPARETWRAADVELVTPGVLWLVRRVLLDDQSLPERLGVTVRGLQMSAGALAAVADSPWLSPLSMVPLETVGCGVVSRFSVTDYQRMGLNPGVRQEHLEYRYDAANSVLTFSATVESPPFSTISLHGEVQKFDPRALAGSNWRKLHVSELAVAYADSGYLAKRNHFCAQQAGISAAQFVAQHVTAVEALLNERGIQPSAEVVRTYRALVAEGGRVSVLSLPAAASTIGDLIDESPDAMTRRLNLTARRNDSPPVMVRLDFQQAPPTAVAGAGDATEAANAPGEATASTAQPAAAATAQSQTINPAPATVAAPAPPKPAPALPAAAATPHPAPAKPAAPAVATHESTPATHEPAPAAHEPTPAAAKPGRTEAAPPAPAADTAPKGGAATGTTPHGLPSEPPPPPGSTLALVWKPTVDRLERVPPPPRDYDVITVDALSGYTGRYVRLITKTQKEVEGRVIGIDANTVGMRIKRAGGTAELHVPRNVIVEVQVPHVRPGNDG